MILRKSSRNLSATKENSPKLHASSYDVDESSENLKNRKATFSERFVRKQTNAFANKSKSSKKQKKNESKHKDGELHEVCLGFYQLISEMNHAQKLKQNQRKTSFLSEHLENLQKTSSYEKSPSKIDFMKEKERFVHPLKKSLEDDSNANKLLLETLKKKQMREIISFKEFHKDSKILEHFNLLLKEKRLLLPPPNLPSEIGRPHPHPPLEKPETQSQRLSFQSQILLTEKKLTETKTPSNSNWNSNLLEKLIPNLPDLRLPRPADFQALPSLLNLPHPTTNISNLEQILTNLKNRSLEPSFLNLPGNKDSAFAILQFLGTMQSEISTYLYNLGMNSNQDNEAKFEKINDFFMALGNSNIFSSFLFPHLHVNNNSNIFNQKQLMPPFKRAGTHVAIAYYIFISKNKDKNKMDPAGSDPTYAARIMREKRQESNARTRQTSMERASSLLEDKAALNELKRKWHLLEKSSLDNEEMMEKIALFSASTKKSGEDFFGETLHKKASASAQSIDELIPKNSSFQNIFQNTPYKSGFKKISPRNSPLLAQTPLLDEIGRMEAEKVNLTEKKKTKLRKICKSKKTKKAYFRKYFAKTKGNCVNKF